MCQAKILSQQYERFLMHKGHFWCSLWRMQSLFIILVMLIVPAKYTSLVHGNSQMKTRNAPSEKILSVVEAVERVKPSIVQIFARLNTPEVNPPRQNKVLGTGFIVSKEGYVVTANHVVNSVVVSIMNRSSDGTQSPVQVPIDATMLRIGLLIPEIDTPQVKMQSSFNVFEFDIIEQDARHDVALLKFKKNPFEIKFTGAIKIDEKSLNTASKVIAGRLAKSKPKDGEQIIISGYPAVTTTLTTTVGYIASTGEINHGEILIPSPYPNIPGQIRQFDSMNLYLCDITANKGNSGGPTYLSKTGEIIGICTGIIIVEGYYSGLAVVVPIQYAIDLLRKHKITF